MRQGNPMISAFQIPPMNLVRAILCLIASATFATAGPAITMFAGSGTKGFAGDGGPATQAQLNGPTGIARGPDGALYICDTEIHRIRKVTGAGTIQTIAGIG